MTEKKATKRSDYVSPQEKIVTDATVGLPSHDEIGRLAHQLWEARGGGDGGTEEDWLEAERLLQEPSTKGDTA
jgi:hypothetical protein